MKIGSKYLGKEVRITWRDPVSSERLDIAKARKGRAALASWVERGIIDDITDGVVRFIQSEAISPGDTVADEAVFGWVPEELIEKCEIMVPEVTPSG